MTIPPRPPRDPKAQPPAHRGLHARMTAQLAVRQFVMLFAAATAFMFILLFFNLYGVITFDSLWNNLPPLSWKFISIPLILVIVYGYVLLTGIVFSLGPSERSFNVFFGIMILLLLVANYDHSLVDWFQSAYRFRNENPHAINPFKILFAGLFFLVLIMMHYNVLSDDFARRMIRRGVPTKEVFQIRSGMFKAVVPAVLTASAIATGLAVLGWLGSLIFGTGGLFIPKLQLLLLAVLIVPMAFLVRSILRDMSSARGKAPPTGPNR